jgi:hypothetical protein
MTGGIGEMYVTFQGALAAGNRALMTVANNSLTGTGTRTIAVYESTPGSSSPRNERQQLRVDGLVSGMSGTFKLEFDGLTTASITWSGTTATLASNTQTALRALANIGATGVNVISTASGIIATFVGPLAGTDVSEMTVAENLLTTGVGRPPIAGATVELWKNGVLQDSGTTDAAGNVRLDVPLPGDGHTIEWTHPDHYPDTVPIGVILGTGNTAQFALNGAVSWVPLDWHLLPVDGEYAGVTITVTSQPGSLGDPWDASGTTDGAGYLRSWIPGAGGGSIAQYDYSFTRDGVPFSGSQNTGGGTGTCGVKSTWGAGGLAVLPGAEWDIADDYPGP